MEELVDNPVTDEVTQEPAPTTSQDDTPQPETEESDTDNADPDFEETEFDGEIFKVPKKLVSVLADVETFKKGIQSNATKQTMEAAELRKAAQAEREEVQREAQINHEIINDLSQLRAVEAELSQYQNVNWQQWQATDKDAAAAGMARMMQLQNTHRQVYGQVEARKAEVATARDRQADNLRSQALEALSKPDPDKGWDGKFDDAKRDKLTKFGREIGYTDDELAGTSHPLMIKTLHLAQIGLEALKKSSAATKPQKIVANPVPTLGAGRATAVVDPNKMTQAQYNKWRDASEARSKNR